jgi:amino acid adenylation domain-containing protein
MSEPKQDSAAEVTELKRRLAALSSEERERLAQRLSQSSPLASRVVSHASALPQAKPLRIEAGAGRVVYPASPTQLWMWFLHEFAPESPAYNTPSAFHLKGPLRADWLEESIRRVVERHETLRTTFTMEGDALVQVVRSTATFDWRVVDLAQLPSEERTSEAEACLRREACVPFRLSTGPLLRTVLVRLAPEEHLLLIVLHHIVSDGWSRSNLCREVTAAYTSLAGQGSGSFPPLPLQFADYSAGRSDWMGSSACLQQEAYWRARLDGVAGSLDLPADHPRPTRASLRGSRCTRVLEPELMEALRARAQEEGATLFMVLLSAFKILLAQSTGQTDLVVGVPIANRRRVEFEGLIGCFINTLVMRTSLAGDLTFREVLHRVKETAIGAYENQDIPLERLVDLLQVRREPGRSPLFQVTFALQDFPEVRLPLPGLVSAPWPVSTGSSIVDLSLTVARSGEGWKATVDSALDLFEPARSERLLAGWHELLKRFVEDPARSIPHPVAAAATREPRPSTGPNVPRREYPRDKCLHQLFEEQAARGPDSVAVVCEGVTMTYRELDQRANQVARRLLAMGVGPDVLVGLYLEPSLGMMVGILGILKAGGAYLPMDLRSPSGRIAFMLEDAQAPALVTQRSLLPSLPATQAQVLCLDDLADSDHGPLDANLVPMVTPDHLAYVIYTSGSTGQPKGCMLSHYNVTRLMRATEGTFGFDSSDVWTLFHSCSFDFSVWEIWGPLLYGGRLVVVPYLVSRSPEAFYELLVTERVTVLNQTPAAFRQLIAVEEDGYAEPLALRYVIFGGEALEMESLRPWFDRHGDQVPKLVNMYGITETTVHVTWRVLSRQDLSAGSVIGIPIDDLQVHVLDEQGNLQPTGVMGELYVSGAGLARGYLRRPELTQQRFVPNPFSADPSERLYRTGDLGRWLPSGELEYLGRIDHQVKIRGFRIELGEIEAVLRKHSGIRDVVVLAELHSEDDQRLMAYLVTSSQAPTVQELRSHALTYLPAYMVPSGYVRVEKIPLTSNGKVDRKALTQLERDNLTAGVDYEAPRDEMERKLVEIWEGVLDRKPIGVRDNFFDLGGHSLRAVALSSRIRQQLGIEMELRWLFEHPTIDGLARRLSSLCDVGATQIHLRPVDRARPLPASFAQQAVWLMQQTLADASTYHVSVAVSIQGPVDAGLVRQSLGVIQNRHELLRTGLVVEGEALLQRVLSAACAELRWEEIDLRSIPTAHQEQRLNELLQDLAREPFDLAVAPLWRSSWIRLGDQQHVLAITFHHCVMDDWSLRIFFDELERLYATGGRAESAQLSELAVQYGDFSVWQRDRLASGLPASRAYWKEQLADFPAALEVPCDKARPSKPSGRGAGYRFSMEGPVVERLRELAREERCTLFAVMLAAFQVWLHRYTGRTDLMVGTPLAQREQPGVKPLLGFFLNMLPIRLRLEGDPGFRDVLRQLWDTTLDAIGHSELPFEQMVELAVKQRQVGRQPLYQVMFVLLEQKLPAVQLGQALGTVRMLETQTSKCDLTLYLNTEGDQWQCYFEYATDLFSEPAVARMAEQWCELVRSICADVELPISRLSLMTAAERSWVEGDWRRTWRDYPRDKCVHQLFEEQVERTPDAIAVSYGGSRLTYRELNAKSNQLAHGLRARGVGPDVLVGLGMERSLEMIVGLLGILKAGGAYVPLDPHLPTSRLQFLIDDTRAGLVLVQSRWREIFDGLSRSRNTPFEILALDGNDDAFAGSPVANPPCVTRPDHLAYVLYTSGTTGQPKGVMVPHLGIVRLVVQPDYVDLGPDEVLLQFAPLSFDASTFEIWGSLLNGARLIVAPAGHLDYHELSELIVSHGVTTLWLTAALFHEMFQRHPEPLVRLRQLLAGGDVLSPTLVRSYLQRPGHGRLINGYGPTENTTFSCCCVLDHPDQVGASVPLGRAISGTEVYVLDRHQQLLPRGVPGELWVGGDGLARGYLGLEELTAERFLSDPFSGRAGARLYRTGDLARFLPDGNVEFLGRMDEQVKIRGYRIEPAEIEKILQGHPGLAGSAVGIRTGQDGARILVGFLVAAEGETLSAADLRRWLLERLPEYMIPTQFVRLEALPLNVNGKVDRKALERVETSTLSLGIEYAAPRNDLERTLAGIWQDVLGLPSVGVKDNFFDLGGHSLLAVAVSARVRQQLRAEMELRWLFEFPTVEGLASKLDRSPRVHRGRERIQRADRTKPLPASPGQQAMWLLHETLADPSAYHIRIAFRAIGSMDAAKTRRCFEVILRRHEVLRTSLISESGHVVQRVVEMGQVELSWREVDLTHLPSEAREAEFLRRLEEEGSERFELGRAPLWRICWYQLGETDQALALTFHHSILDEWSLRLLLNEWEELYAADADEGAATLSSVALQYADFAAWQRERLTGEFLEQERAYWREQLRDLPPVLELPSDRIRPARPSGRGADYRFSISVPEVVKLRELAREEQTTLFTVLLTAFQVWLHRYSGQSDLVVGTPIAQRDQPETQSMIGFFLNMLPMRLKLEGNPGFLEALRMVRATCLDAFEHAALPFEQMVEMAVKQRQAGQQPLYQVMFVLMEEGLPGLRVGDAACREQDLVARTSKNDLSWTIQLVGDTWECRLEYATDLFRAATVERMAEQLRELLRSICANPSQPVAALNLMSQRERLQLEEEWSRVRCEYPQDKCLPQLFEEQVHHAPNAIAVVYGNGSLTYCELNARADQLAHYLRKRGVGPDVLVGLYLERSLEMIVGLLGILKAGGAYLPLDPEHPRERLRLVMEDASVSLLVSEGSMKGQLPTETVPVVFLDEMTWGQNEAPPEKLPVLQPESMAYVLYTSGSTGRPKGVEISHRALVNCLWHFRSSLAMEPSDVWLAITTVSFDISGLEIWLPLISGARCVVASRETVVDGALLRQRLQEVQATILQATPATWNMLLLAGWTGSPRLRLLCGGEAMPPELADRLPALGASAWNVYGPTETTIWSAAKRLRSGESVTIGNPIANTRLYLLDRSHQLVPVGMVGELFIGGDGVARGYRHRPDLTAERFVPDPFAGVPGARMYATGDLVRRLPNGELEYLGRSDHQVKIRGHRIELGEIESVLRGVSGVEDVAVVVTEQPGQDKVLVACLACPKAPMLDLAELREWLSGKLPSYMIPSAVTIVDALPRTSSGKVDRNALARMQGQRLQQEVAYLAPRDELETELAELWQEFLGRDRVGVRDDFFALGGHSLLAARLFARIEQRYGKRLPLATLFESPTIEGIARVIHGKKSSASWRSLVVMQPEGRGVPIFLVHGLAGNVVGFNPLVQHLGDDRPVYGLQSVGLDGLTPPLQSIPEMAEHYLKEVLSVCPEGPYHVGGLSFGGMVAYEMARQLAALGKTVGVVALFDTFPRMEVQGQPWRRRLEEGVDHWRKRVDGHWRDMRSLDLEGLPNYIAQKGRTITKRTQSLVWQSALRLYLAAGGRDGEVLPKVFANIEQANRMASRRYITRSYPGKVTLFMAAAHHPWAKQGLRTSWNELALGGVEVREVPGTHVTLIEEPHVRVLAEELRRCLKR